MTGRDRINGKKALVRVCEGSFLQLLGYIRSANASSANHMWQAFKKIHFRDKKIDSEKSDSEDESSADSSSENGQPKRKLPRLKLGRKKSLKYVNAEAFLRDMMEIYGDTMPTSEGTNSTGDKQRKILPYETVKSLHREYLWQCSIEKTHPKLIARKTCFAKVFLSLQDEIRLLGCKGMYFQAYYR